MTPIPAAAPFNFCLSPSLNEYAVVFVGYPNEYDGGIYPNLFYFNFIFETNENK